MTTFVQLQEQDPLLNLAAFLDGLGKEKESDSDKKGDKKKKVKGKGDYSTFLEAAEAKDVKYIFYSGFLKVIDQILASDEATDCAFSIGLTVVTNLASSDEKEQPDAGLWKTLIPQLAEALAADRKAASRNLKALADLYNSRPLNSKAPEAPALRYQVFFCLMTYALDTQQASSVVFSFNKIDDWIKGFKLQVPELRKTYNLVAQLYNQAQQPADTQKYRILYLKTYEGGKETKTPPEADEVAAAAIVSELSSPCGGDHQTLLKSKIVAGFAKSEKYGGLHRLLEIFTRESVQSYLKFTQAKENKEYLVSHGLKHEELLRKIRTLTVCSLGLTQEVLPYKQLIEALQVKDEQELQIVVLEAVQSGKIEVKIDEETETVHIERSTPRVFEDEHWKDLSVKLALWKSKLNHVMTTLQQTQSQDGPTQ